MKISCLEDIFNNHFCNLRFKYLKIKMIIILKLVIIFLLQIVEITEDPLHRNIQDMPLHHK